MTVTDVTPLLTITVAETLEPPMTTATVRFTSAPVLLKDMLALEAETEAEAKPLPRFNCAAPLACKAIVKSGLMMRPSVTPLTPTFIVPDSSTALALLLATIRSPLFLSMPKSPVMRTKLETVASSPMTLTALDPFKTLTPADTVEPPTLTDTVVFTSEPVLL